MTGLRDRLAALGVSGLALRAILLVMGALIATTGVNVAFGGIETLGLQGPRDFLVVADQAAFIVQDNHVRFLGGLWLAVGLVFAAAAIQLRVFRGPLVACVGMIVLGGLARFSTPDPGVVLGPSIVGSLAIELLAMPLLALWAWRTV
jgi:hypothetical protein